MPTNDLGPAPPATADAHSKSKYQAKNAGWRVIPRLFSALTGRLLARSALPTLLAVAVAVSRNAPPLPRLMLRITAALAAMLALANCHAPRTFIHRAGDEIVVAGQLFHTGTRVVTWMDPGGYDAYRVERRFSPLAESGWKETQAAERDVTSPNRYGQRNTPVPDAGLLERTRGGGWALADLQNVIDQFVLHYDAAGLSRLCFESIHDHRGLSIHFMIDVDGTIYQTLDVKERAWHATTANSRSIGVEIANIGAFPPADAKPLDEWYRHTPGGSTMLTIPAKVTDPMIRTANFTGHPARAEPIAGNVQGQDLIQYDFTPQQYRALIKLTAALCTVFPKIQCDYPRDANGKLITGKLPDDQLASYRGVLGHYHVQANKTDPGPAFQWDRLINGAKALLVNPP